REPNDRYQFGFSKYEPLTAFLSGVLILALCAAGVKYAIQDIIHPEEVKSYQAGVYLAVMTMVISFILVPVLRKASQRFHSMILEVNAVGWFNDGLSSLGIAVGFLLAWQFSHLGQNRWAAYVDPMMSLVLAGFLVVEPIRIVRFSMEDLLDVNPGGLTISEARELAERVRKEFNLSAIRRLRLRRAGRRIFLEVGFTTKPEMPIKETARLNQRIAELSKEIFQRADVTVCFSCQKAKSE
ncbi:MAG: cation transporter, partial [Candidatus Omnitrophica bacterium]|nr:cation transporter [Candidatus Omnitrophota bacterium]